MQTLVFLVPRRRDWIRHSRSNLLQVPFPSELGCQLLITRGWRLILSSIGRLQGRAALGSSCQALPTQARPKTKEEALAGRSEGATEGGGGDPLGPSCKCHKEALRSGQQLCVQSTITLN